MTTPELFDINLPMLDDWQVIYTPTGEEVNKSIFDYAWFIGTRVKRGLEGHVCDCNFCKRGMMEARLSVNGYDTTNIDLYKVEPRIKESN